MQFRASLLNDMLNNSFRAIGPSAGATYRVYLRFSNNTSSSKQDVTFANASGGIIGLSTKPVYFAVSSGLTVSSVRVERQIGGTTIDMYEVALDTPETYTTNGIFSVLDTTVKLEPQV